MEYGFTQVVGMAVPQAQTQFSQADVRTAMREKMLQLLVMNSPNKTMMTYDLETFTNEAIKQADKLLAPPTI
jgi:hypothetical protein